MFKFDFDIEDADDAELAEKILNQNQVYGQKAVIPQHPFAEISMSQLVRPAPFNSVVLLTVWCCAHEEKYSWTACHP